MNAIEDSEFSRAWEAMGVALPRPDAILCISAHWETQGTWVTAAVSPPTLHDFRGFPPALSQFRYSAPGSPELAGRICRLLPDYRIQADLDRGLDHGAWSVLCRLFPAADVPVVQLSLDRGQPAEFHLHLGAALAELREEGILILGSGNIVHNLETLVWRDTAFDWAEEFDGEIRRAILADDLDSVTRYQDLGPIAAKAVPSPEHFLPLLYVLGAALEGDGLRVSCEKVTLGSISMTCVLRG